MKQEFNSKLKREVFKTIMRSLSFDQKLEVLSRFFIERYRIRNSDVFSESDFGKENKDRFKQQLSVLAIYSALRKTVGEEKALGTMLGVLKTSAGEAIGETLQLISKMTSFK